MKKTVCSQTSPQRYIRTKVTFYTYLFWVTTERTAAKRMVQTCDEKFGKYMHLCLTENPNKTGLKG